MGNLVEGVKGIDGEGKRGEGVDFNPAKNPEVGINVSPRSRYMKLRVEGGLTQSRIG